MSDCQPVTPLRHALVEFRLLSIEMRQQSRQIERWNLECRDVIRRSYGVLADTQAFLRNEDRPSTHAR